MPVTLSIKTVPDSLAKALRACARRNHRSIQGELMSILELTVGAKPFQARALLDRVRALGVETPDEAVEGAPASRGWRSIMPTRCSCRLPPASRPTMPAICGSPAIWALVW